MININNEKEIGVEDRVVVFTYTNTRPDYQGIVTALSEHFLEVKQFGFGGKTQWEPREKVEKIKSWKS